MLLTALALAAALAPTHERETSMAPETVIVASGQLRLHGLLWHPRGDGPFPAVLFSHGSHSAGDPLNPDSPAIVGSVFARHGYVFLLLFRRGMGPSADQGPARLAT